MWSAQFLAQQAAQLAALAALGFAVVALSDGFGWSVSGFALAGLLRLPAPLCLGYVAAAWSDAAAFAGVALALVLGVVMLALNARFGARP